MGFSISTVGQRAPPLEPSMKDNAAKQLQAEAVARAAAHNAALKKFIASLPGNAEDGTVLGAQSKPLPDELSLIVRKLKYIVDFQSNEVLVKVIDPNTDKVIKILPPAEIQMLNRNSRDYSGFLFDLQV